MYLSPEIEAQIDKEIAASRKKAKKFQKELVAMEKRTGRKNPDRGKTLVGLDNIGRSVSYDIATILDGMVWRGR